MSADRELLELAAKAAGIGIMPCTCGNDKWPFKHVKGISPQRGHWNPLESDGDALRLAVSLRIDLEWQDDYSVEAYHRTDDSHYCSDGQAGPGVSIGAATRRAIVRAAAEIGKAMP